jgi:hypothetical protein
MPDLIGSSQNQYTKASQLAGTNYSKLVYKPSAYALSGGDVRTIRQKLRT